MMKFNNYQTKDRMNAKWQDILREIDRLRKQTDLLVEDIEAFSALHAEDLCLDIPKTYAEDIDGSTLDIIQELIHNNHGDITFRIGAASVKSSVILSKLTVEDALLLKRIAKLREMADKMQCQLSGLFTATRTDWEVVPYIAIPHEKKED
jgi:dynactin complex subunit